MSETRDLKENPTHLLWLDLETTGLSPESDKILEIAWILTSFEFPYLESRRAQFLLDVPGLIRPETKVVSGSFVAGLHPKVQEMHDRSGLWKELTVASQAGELSSLRSVEELLLHISEDWPLGKHGRVRVAGFSVHFDLGFLRVHMPEFARRLSHRVFDASAVSDYARSLGMPRLEHSEAHRAREDVMAAITHVRRVTRWMLSLDAVVKAGAKRFEIEIDELANCDTEPGGS